MKIKNTDKKVTAHALILTNYFKSRKVVKVTNTK